MSETDRRPSDQAAREKPTAASPTTFEKRSRHRPATAASTALKQAEGEFDAEPTRRFGLWVGVGVAALLGVGAWLILSGVV
jgi:hypothetical protein